jgi:DHA2 family multidrug resistance protein
LAALAIALTALEIGLKDAPQWGWSSGRVLILLGLFAAAGMLFAVATLRSAYPIVELRSFADRNFTIGCILSFVLGIGLFGSTYLMPFFLGLVRGHGALEIGETMLVTGSAQLAVAPVAVALERRLDPRLLTVFGFLLFAGGLGMSAFQTRETDFAEMLIPQILRGSAIMFCLLPPTRLALGRLPAHLVADGSGLFNLMRNMGGAIGLALIDTVIFGRGTGHARRIAERLGAGDVDMAVTIGIPKQVFLANLGHPPSALAVRMAQSLIQREALVQSINDAWAVMTLLTFVAVLLVPFVRAAKSAEPSELAS